MVYDAGNCAGFARANEGIRSRCLAMEFLYDLQTGISCHMQCKTILYIEDNQANLTLLERVIGLMDGVRMVPGTSGEEGLDLVEQVKPDLILLDINLPGISGLEVLHSLKGMPHTSAIPVIALTASASNAELEEGLEAGFNEYLTKPFHVKDFLEIVKGYLYVS